MIKEHAEKMLDDQICLDISDAPNQQDLFLPVIHIEVDCVQVGHNHGGIKDVVEEHQDRQDHVSNINISTRITADIQNILGMPFYLLVIKKMIKCPLYPIDKSLSMVVRMKTSPNRNFLVLSSLFFFLRKINDNVFDMRRRTQMMSCGSQTYLIIITINYNCEIIGATLPREKHFFWI